MFIDYITSWKNESSSFLYLTTLDLFLLEILWQKHVVILTSTNIQDLDRQHKTAQNVHIKEEQLKLSPHSLLLRLYLCTNKTILYILYSIANGDKLENQKTWLNYRTLWWSHISTALPLCIKHQRKACHKNAKREGLSSRYLVTEQWAHFVLMLYITIRFKNLWIPSCKNWKWSSKQQLVATLIKAKAITNWDLNNRLVFSTPYLKQTLRQLQSVSLFMHISFSGKKSTFLLWFK